MEKELLIEKITTFLNEIGITTPKEVLSEATFLPGLKILGNSIIIDSEKLLYPGDILHEAGHIAVTPSQERIHIGTEKMDKDWPSQGDEIGAMLWSYAASVHLELPNDVVFHPNGYKGSSQWLIESYTQQNYIGLPFLEWCGLTASNKNDQNGIVFPQMKQWLRD